jgi:hypothetical protein
VWEQVDKRFHQKVGGNYPVRARFILLQKGSLNKLETRKNDTHLPIGHPFEFKTALFTYSADEKFTWNQFITSEIKDPEVLCSAARWYWLIYDSEIMKRNSAEDIVRLSKHWIRSFGYEESALEWEAYNASERITSFTNAMLMQVSYRELIQIIKEDIEVSSFLQHSIFHLSRHLEYYPGGVTYNHVVNNLKGILTAAMLLEDEKLLNETADLFVVEADILLIEDGFIREGSSHYQLIVTRWFIELELLCELSGRNKLKVRLETLTKKMIQRCLFYFVWNEESKSLTLPLICDLSPDFDPDWMVDYFSDLFVSPYESKIRGSYGWRFLKTLGYNQIKRHFRTDSIHQSESITRLDIKDWTLFVRHQAHDGNFFPNHAHDDYSSFILFFKGAEIISDPGRLNYLDMDSSLNYVQAMSHNVITVNELSIQTSEWKRHLLPFFYKKNGALHSTHTEEGETIITLRANSLSRVANCDITDYERRITMTGSRLTIEDYLQGTGDCVVGGQIIFNPNVTVTETKVDSVLLWSGTNKLELSVENAMIQVNNKRPYSGRYQVEHFSSSLRYKEQMKLPLTIKMEIKIN